MKWSSKISHEKESNKDFDVSESFLGNKNHNPFLTPDNYFDSLPLQINNRIHKSPIHSFFLKSSSRSFRWISTVSILVIILGVTYLAIYNPSTSRYLAQNNTFLSDTNKKQGKGYDSLDKIRTDNNAIPQIIGKYEISKTIQENNITVNDVVEYLEEENALDAIYEL